MESMESAKHLARMCTGRMLYAVESGERRRVLERARRPGLARAANCHERDRFGGACDACEVILARASPCGMGELCIF
jgi:ferredoxin